MFQNLKKPSWWLLIFASIAWLLVWALTLQIEFEKAPVNTAIQNALQQRILLEIDLAQQDLNRAKVELKKQPKLRFTAFNDSKQPFTYIFDDTTAYYWGNNSFALSWSEASKLPKTAYIVSNGWACLVVSDTLQSERLFSLYRIIPLLRKYGIESGNLPPEIYLKEVSGLVLSSQKAVDGTFQINNQNGEPLFSINPKGNTSDKEPEQLSAIKNGLAALALAFTLAWGLHFISLQLTRKGHYRKGFLAVALLLGGFKILLVAIYFPSNFLASQALSKPLLAVQFIGPTLGDLLINLILASFLALYLFRFFLGSKLYAKAVTLPQYLGYSLATACILANYFLLYGFYLIARGLLAGVGNELDIASSLQFNAERNLGYLALLIAAVITYMLSHTVIRFALNLLHQRAMPAILLALLATAFAFGIAQLFGLRYVILLPLNLAFCLFILVFRIPKLLADQKEPSYLYYLIYAFLLASIGTYALRNHIQHGLWENKHRFVADITDTTSQGPENLFGKWLKDIKESAIKTPLPDSVAVLPTLVSQIKNSLPAALDRDFNIDIQLTNAKGKNLDTLLPNQDFAFLEKTWFRNAQRLRTSDIYGITETQTDIISSYASRFMFDSAQLPYIVHIILNPKIPFTGNIMPALMAAKTTNLPFLTSSFSYSVWENKERTFNSGNFNYNRSFAANYLTKDELYKSGLTIEEFHHLGIVIEGETYVVSSASYPIKSLFVNLCFQFLLMSALSILVLFIQIVIRQQYQNLTLGTKIQLYLNGAFFLPLVVVCALTLSVMSSTYRNDLNKAFLANAEKIAQQLQPTLERKENQNTLNAQLQQIASIAALDINLYNTIGRINQSSQTSLFDKKLISQHISPEALASLLEARQNAILLPQQLGTINFKVAYVALRSKNEGRLLALLAVPFIESNEELDHQVSDVVGTMIILFTCILVLFIGLSYSVSRQLVIPLRLLTRRLKRTNLAKYSPLEWNSKDEIGLLVKEYNNMLKKLQVSTEALSKSEKESAWREMAKQVAHEIKNPLTPMKLTLQYLEQARAQNNPNQERITEKAIQTLLTQIENLSDIATSFAAFAQMPLPRQEPFNLVQTAKQTVNLYRSNNEINLTTHFSETELWVTGDEKLISRIITNLILNAIQSVPESRVPEINLHLFTDSTFAHFSLSDNGIGIDNAIAEKIFMPNFSTKNGGTGIGLAVAKRGIEQLKGRIWFQTIANEGTTFHFELPLIQNAGAIDSVQ